MNNMDLSKAIESFSARLDRVEALLTRPRDPVQEIRQLAAARPVSVRELRGRGYTALQLVLADVGENLCGLPALLHGGYSWSDVVHAEGTQKAAANACLEAGVSVTRLVEAGAPVELLTAPALALAEANRGYRSSAGAHTGEGSGPSERLLDRIRELLGCGASVASLVHAGAPPHLLLKAGVSGSSLIKSGVGAKSLVDGVGLPLGSFILPPGTRVAFPRSFSNWSDVMIEAGGPDEYHLTYVQCGRRAGVSMRMKDMINYGLTLL